MNSRTKNVAPMARTTARLAALMLLTAPWACASQAPSPRVSAESSGAEGASASEGEETMMVIRVVLDVKPEHTAELVEYLRTEALQVRQLDGCLRYELFADPENDNRFLLYEEWDSGEAFSAYQDSELLRRSFAVLGPMMAGPPDSTYFRATPQEP